METSRIYFYLIEGKLSASPQLKD